MPETITGLDTSISDIKDTDSGLVEFSASGSLQEVVEKVRNLLAERGIPYVTTQTDLQALTADEATLAYLEGAGLFVYGATDLGSGFESTDGGFWNRDLSIAITDMVSGTPANGQAPIWNAGSSSAVWGAPTVSALGWANITAKPAQLSGLVATDELIKYFGGATKSIGTAVLGAGNTILAANGAVTYMTAATNSVIITDMTSFRPGIVPFTVNNSTIIGDCGDLSALFTADVLDNVIVIGQNGTPAFIMKADGTVSMPVAVSLEGASVANGAFTVAGAFTAEANIIAEQHVSVVGNLGTSGDFLVDGVATFEGANIAMNNLPVYASNALALAGLTFTGRLYRNGDNICITH